MQRLARTLGIPVAILALLGPAAAQEVGEEVSLTGCLAQEEDEGEEAEFLLENVKGTEIMAEEIELVAGEGIDLAPHVGHTVEVTGLVIAEDEEEVEEGEMEEEMEEEESHEDEDLRIRVTKLGHKSASCEEGR